MPGPQELIVIAVVALLVFGPDRLPEVMRNGAQLLARFREQSQKSIDELKQAAEFEEVDRELQGLRREVREATSTVGEELKGARRTAREAGRGRPTTGAEAQQPPPVDLEAT